MRRLVLANLALAVLLAGHIADHVVRQPAAGEIGWPANLPAIVGVVSIAVSLGLALARHPLAVPVAVLVGAGNAVGFAAVHLLPEWSLFSDPYAARDLDAASWIQMLASLAGGAVLAAVALRTRRPARGAAAA